MENKNRVNLNNMLDNLYCEVYESTNNCTVLWNYNTYKIVETIYKTKGKEIKKVDNTENSADFNYIQLLPSCIKEFEKEIEQNVYSLFGTDKVEYLQSIYEDYDNRIVNIKSGIELLTSLKQIHKNGRVVRDRDKIYPIQEQCLSKFLIRLKKKYQTYLFKTKMDENKPQLTISEIALKQFFIYKYENGKEINKINAKTFFKNTSYETSARLIKWYKDFKDDSNRLSYNTNKREDTKSLNTHIERYEHILPELKANYPKAFKAAEEELKTLQLKKK